MKILNEKYNADFTIESETTLVGMIVGDVTVRNSTIFIVRGMLFGNLSVEENSRTIIYGTVKGSITNFGICEIYGLIDGNLSGTTNQIFIDKNARVNKK